MKIFVEKEKEKLKQEMVSKSKGLKKARVMVLINFVKQISP